MSRDGILVTRIAITAALAFVALVTVATAYSPYGLIGEVNGWKIYWRALPPCPHPQALPAAVAAQARRGTSTPVTIALCPIPDP
jgi:hypothetical protein